MQTTCIMITEYTIGPIRGQITDTWAIFNVSDADSNDATSVAEAAAAAAAGVCYQSSILLVTV